MAMDLWYGMLCGVELRMWVQETSSGRALYFIIAGQRPAENTFGSANN